ncbi:MAG: BON domain-containing protein [Candidatus Competibacteraceae bacterium]
MNKFSLTLAFLAALATAGCAGFGGSSSDSSGVTSTSSLSDSGRGGAKVSDSEITAGVKDAFKQDDLIANANISVATDQGVVSLSGRLSARAANRALSLARSVTGVRRVVWDKIEYVSE